MAMNNLENLATAIGTDIKDIKTQTANSQAKISANTESINRIATQMDSLATKSEVKQDIDGLAKTLAKVQVGGRNYYRDSEKIRASTRFFLFPIHPYLSQENIGETWTLSFDLKINEGGEIRPLHFYHYQRNRFGLKASADITPSKEWQRFTFTGPVIFPNDDPRYSRGDMALYDFAGNNSYSVRRIKLEKGNVATDWSPAPEDAQTQAVETQESLRGLERKFETIASDVKVLNQKPEPRLTLTGNTLSIAGGNNVTLPIPENVGVEIRGTGSPEGRITAEIGTTYVDVNMTNGALKWIKQSGTGNTGWKVIHGDTGWVLGWQYDMAEEFNVAVVNRMYFRRINDVIHVKFEPKIQDSTVSATANLVLENRGFSTEVKLSINGFQPINNIVQTIFQIPPDILVTTSGAENSEGSQGTGAVIIQYEYNHYKEYSEKTGLKLQIVTSQLGVEENHVNPFSYLTEDEWPTTLPTIGG